MWRKTGLIALILSLVAMIVLPATALAAGDVAVVRTARVQVALRVINPSKDATQDLMITVPPVVMNRAGWQKVLAVEFTTKPAFVKETPAGKAATYSFPAMAPGESLTVQQVYTVELAAGASVITDEKVDGQYLQPAAGIESGNQAIRAKTAEVTADLTRSDAKAEAIMTFVSRNIKYDLFSPARNRGALAGFNAGTGVCSEYASLFVAMSRAAGIPARLVYGWGNSRALNGALNGQNRHVWAEYYSTEQKGWVAVDPTFATVLPLSQVMSFDGLNHVAQDRMQTSVSMSYGGLGYLGITSAYALSDAGQQTAAAR